MDLKEKELLKDLCARLPYGVECEAILNNGGSYPCVLDIGTLSWHINGDHVLKPYLRPMSSMTEEERAEFYKVGGLISHKVETDTYVLTAFSPEAYDWLNAHYFDYRGLIEKNLALDCTGLHIYVYMIRFA